jgi:hypothetical protein
MDDARKISYGEKGVDFCSRGVEWLTSVDARTRNNGPLLYAQDTRRIDDLEIVFFFFIIIIIIISYFPFSKRFRTDPTLFAVHIILHLT